MSVWRVSFVLFLIIFHNGFALHYKYDPRWKWKENQFVDLNKDYYKHESDDTHTSSKISTTTASTYPPIVQGTSEGTDEDLLDLMVRIAETPSEWEKIHQVLNQLGKGKIKSNNNYDVKKLGEKILLETSTTRKPFTTTPKPSSEFQLGTHTKTSTLSGFSRDNQISTTSKPIWPDIFKNEYEKLFWNAENIYDEEMSDEDDDEDEENYFSEYQWDEEDKSVKNDQNIVNSFNRIHKVANKVMSKPDVYKKGSHKTNSKPSSVNSIVNNSNSDLNIVNNDVNNKKYDFVHFLNSLTSSTVRTSVANVSHHDNVQRHSDDSNSAREDNWPNFSYHRVTVNPNKEKFKNLSKAFIVVSEISPKTNTTIIEAHVKNIEDLTHESESNEQLSVNSRATEKSEKSRDGKTSKEKVFRHHWRDKQKKHTKRRHHRTHPHPVHPDPDY